MIPFLVVLFDEDEYGLGAADGDPFIVPSMTYPLNAVASHDYRSTAELDNRNEATL